MQHKHNLITINIILCDVWQNKNLFSDILMMFRDDFAQTLLMITHEIYADCCMYVTDSLMTEFYSFKSDRKHVILYRNWKYCMRQLNCKDVIWFIFLWADHDVTDFELMIYCWSSFSSECLSLWKTASCFWKSWVFQ